MKIIQDLECNNCSYTRISTNDSSQKQDQNHSLLGRVIRVEGDGRCLFRSLATCLHPDLQKTRRDDFGCALRREDANYETYMADILRAKVVKLMQDNAHFYSQLEQVVLNADLPIPPGYCHFRERLNDMTLASTMPGDLELNAIATVLERQVLVLDTNLFPIVAYGKERYPQNEVVAVRYTKLGQDVGHYDAVILEDAYVLDPIVTQSFNRDGNDFIHLQGCLTKLYPEPRKHWKGLRNQDYLVADCGVQVPSETDLSEFSNTNMIFSRKTFDRDENDKNNLVNNINTNKCHISIYTESENENRVSENRCEKQYNEMLLDTYDSDNVLYVVISHDIDIEVSNGNKVFDAVQSGWNTQCNSSSTYRAPENDKNRHLSSNDRKRRKPGEKRITHESLERSESLKQIISPQGRDEIKQSRNNSEERKSVPQKRKLKTWNHKGARKKRRKYYFKTRKIKRRSSIPPRRTVRTSCLQKTEALRRSRSKSSRKANVKEKAYHTKTVQNNVILKKSIGDYPQHNTSGKNSFDSRTCFVCFKPIPKARRSLSVCILCGRVAHRECVDRNRKEQGGDYSLCWFCVPE